MTMSDDLANDATKWRLNWRVVRRISGNHWPATLHIAKLCLVIAYCAAGMERWFRWPASGFHKGYRLPRGTDRWTCGQTSILAAKSCDFTISLWENGWKGLIWASQISEATGPIGFIQAANHWFFPELLNETSTKVIRAWAGAIKPIQKSLLQGFWRKRPDLDQSYPRTDSADWVHPGGKPLVFPRAFGGTNDQGHVTNKRCSEPSPKVVTLWNFGWKPWENG